MIRICRVLAGVGTLLSSLATWCQTEYARVELREVFCIDGGRDLSEDHVNLLIARRLAHGEIESRLWPEAGNPFLVAKGKQVVKPEDRITLWEGLIGNGAGVDVCAVVFELKDTSDVSDDFWGRVLNNVFSGQFEEAKKELADLANSSASFGYIGSFIVHVKNDQGVIRQSITRGKWTAHEGYNDEPKTSKLGKTFRIVMHHDEILNNKVTYGAEIQVRIHDGTDNGLALSWE